MKHRPYIVAEISGNHAGSIENAMRLILDANEAGADAVKFQCFDPERLAARRATRSDVLALAGGVPLIDLYRKIHTPREWFPYLIEHATTYGMEWFSSVFDPDDVAFLEMLNCPRYKISAFEMLDWDIIKAVRETGKPIVMSVRQMPGVTIMQATDYNGAILPLGLSAHSQLRLPPPGAPMVEYHLKLDGIETPDSAFSLTQEQLRTNVQLIREMNRAR
jgi:sialic acid synthase SpsE